jgi:hypothetical protein
MKNSLAFAFKANLAGILANKNSILLVFYTVHHVCWSIFSIFLVFFSEYFLDAQCPCGFQGIFGLQAACSMRIRF